MNVLLTSTGLETDTIKTYFMDMVNKNMSTVQALFIPTAAINADATLIFTNYKPKNRGIHL